MPKVALLNIQGEEVGQIELSDGIFAVPVNKTVLHEVVVAQLANRRQGTQSTLTRSEVAGGGRKPWRQKGTGRARQGSTRSPQWRHGGVIFAPKPRDYSKSVNKKVKRLAMKSALSSKVNEESLLVLDALNIPEAKTREMVRVLDNLKVERKALLVLPGADATVQRAASNLPNVKTLYVNTLNVLDILNYDTFIVTQDAVRMIEEVYA